MFHGHTARLWLAAVLLLASFGHAGAADVTTPANPAFDAMEKAFMNGQLDGMDALLREVRRTSASLNVQQRKDLAYISREWRRVRPDWWKATKHTENNSFQASMWDKRFAANYMPTEQLGLQAPIGIDPKTRRLLVIVTWRPSMVDNPAPLEGWLAERHKLTQGNLAEVIVWHELGHNYVTLHLPAMQAIDLFTNHLSLYKHAQEFYADMTAIRHCSPKSTRVQLMMRLREMSVYNESQAHTRAAHAIGAILLSEWMTHPDKWPMVRFPPRVPADNVELETIKYCYKHLKRDWTLNEYIQLRDYVEKWMRTGRKGDMVLKSKGRVKLDNRLEMYLMAGDDRAWQPKRDAWVADELAKLIASGRADKKVTEKVNGVNTTVLVHPDGEKAVYRPPAPGLFTGIMVPH